MESQANIQLNILSEEDAWNLFVKKTRKSIDESTKFYDVARTVARECAGIPVALIAVARALKDKGFEEWKEAARRLQMSQHANVDDDERDVYECIKLCYDYLDCNDAKSCFLLCCLFPEDYDIQSEELMKFGFGIGLFRHVNSTIEDARVIANSVMKYLNASCLLLDGIMDGCGRWMQTRASQQSHLWRTTFASFLKNWVLDLRGTSISVLPLSFSLLTNLQALYLDYCNKRRIDISILGHLKKLEILSMTDCHIKEFPKEIGNMTNLRMFKFSSRFGIKRIPSHVISRLEKLEELYLQCKFGDWGRKVGGRYSSSFGKNAEFHEVTGLSRLNLLEVPLSDAQCLPQTVKFAPNWVSFVIFIDKSAGWPMPSSLEHDFPHLCSRALSLNTAINTLPDWFNKVVTEKAEKLDYVECRGLNNIIEEYDHGRLHALKYLGLYGSHENMKELMNTRTRVSNRPMFENLEQLNVKKADCLEDMCVGELQPGSLCNLKLLVVAYCHKIVNALLPLNLLQRVQKLETLVCHHMNRMDYVFEFAALEPEQVILTEKKEMKLLVLGALISIWKDPAPYANFHNLKSLEVYECTKLRSLFTLDVAECLLQLEDLSVGSCSGLDRVIEASNEIENKNIVLPKLKDLLLKDLPELTMFCVVQLEV
uniref:disease resistance protein At4g27190-like n=1 Tax=Fragaria vesca subsp. vesca TaxID=101020 RepID=UPI0005C9C21B|nr:PREDICTED: disease resistance protein At4g27190-like [Fragaria vesca subsp. vesca]